jgi:geranylgeranyl pyrophosphate synthase
MNLNESLAGKSTAAFRPIAVPRHIVQQRFRPASERIPPTRAERNQMLQFVRHYVAEFNPVPPLPLEHLREHADRVVQLLKCSPQYRDYAGVVINNEIWREALACVPYRKRLLLLPKCLRVENKCPAPVDDFGLLCKRCGLCTIQDLQAEAGQLGYAVLVAEGSAMVMSLIQTGKIEAIVGVSCLGVLERAFPYMESAAIPGLAIPLLQDDCADTTVDLEWVWDYIHLTSDDGTRRLDLGSLRTEVDSWFTEASLESILGAAEGQTEQIAREWLARAGKRWRPFLAVAAFRALRPNPSAPLPEDIRKLAVAVECFHKASLIHDDIEDGDATRYGEQTVHEEHGVGVALNVGDLLIGEGYRMLAACSQTGAEQKAEMLTVASSGQRQLCKGQGAELCWARSPRPLKVLEVLDIFRKKTAPAFEVALKLGGLYAQGFQEQPGNRNGHKTGADAYGEIAGAMQVYSEALGIAYQIRDDLADYEGDETAGDLANLRPGLLLAIAYERAQETDKQVLTSLWNKVVPHGLTMSQVKELFAKLNAEERALKLLETYKEEAVRSLRAVENPNLKGLLRRVIGRIFNDPEIKGWCKEFAPQGRVD